jgi:hypothetical protein
MTTLFKLNLVEVQSAIVYGLLTALVGILGYVIEIGDIFLLDWKNLVNIAVISFSITMISLIKNFLTDSDGVFAGIVKVK